MLQADWSVWNGGIDWPTEQLVEHPEACCLDSTPGFGAKRFEG